MPLDRPDDVVYAPGVAERHRDSTALLAREFEHGLALIRATPELGQRARTSRFGRLHRMLLPKCRYHVYDRIHESANRVDIVLFRHAQRRALR